MLDVHESSRAREIDGRAHRAATSPLNDLRAPTAAQKQAGNYKHGHVQVQGVRIAIENPAGSVRSGVDRDGRIWRTVMQHHYGRIKGTDGADGEDVDVFLGPHPESELVFVIDQVDPETGRFDEQKVIIGALSEAEARGIYQANYAPGWKGLGDVTALPIEEFKEWLAHHDTRAPMASNRLPASMVFTKTYQVDADGRILAKAQRPPVQSPGSRGGRFWVDREGRIHYGEPPHPEAVKKRLTEADKLRLYDAEQGIDPVQKPAHPTFAETLTDLRRRLKVWYATRERALREIVSPAPADDPGHTERWRKTLDKIDAHIQELRGHERGLERLAASEGSGPTGAVTKAQRAPVRHPGSRGGRYYIDDPICCESCGTDFRVWSALEPCTECHRSICRWCSYDGRCERCCRRTAEKAADDLGRRAERAVAERDAAPGRQEGGAMSKASVTGDVVGIRDALAAFQSFAERLRAEAARLCSEGKP